MAEGQYVWRHASQDILRDIQRLYRGASFGGVHDPLKSFFCFSVAHLARMKFNILMLMLAESKGCLYVLLGFRLVRMVHVGGRTAQKFLLFFSSTKFVLLSIDVVLVVRSKYKERAQNADTRLVWCPYCAERAQRHQQRQSCLRQVY